MLGFCLPCASILFSSVVAATPPQETVVFEAGRDGYHTYRIPALLVSSKGTILAFCEGRKNSAADDGDIDLLVKRSSDGGRTFGPARVVRDDGENTVGNPCPVVDRSTGILWLLFCRNNECVFVTSSGNDGETWAPPREITTEVKPENWTWYATGPVHGIQLDSGRLLIPCDHRVLDSASQYSHIVYSDDHGQTWGLGGVLDENTDECTALQTKDRRVYLNMRSYLGKNRRAVAWSADGGLTWSQATLDDALVEPVCQASVLRVPATDGGNDLILFSNPASEKRVALTVRASRDDGRTWNAGLVLWPGPAAYSDLALAPDGDALCLYERGEGNPYESIVLARCPLDAIAP